MKHVLGVPKACDGECSRLASDLFLDLGDADPFDQSGEGPGWGASGEAPRDRDGPIRRQHFGARGD